MNLSKSKYCNAVQCNKMLWLSEYMPEEKSEVSNESVLENGTEVGELAKNLFEYHVDIEFNKNLNKMIEDTNKALKEENTIITEASFCYKNNFCSVDILRKNNNEIEIYEVKSSTHITDIYLDDISYQVYILKNLGYKIKKACIVYINRNYERKKELDLKKLFIIKNVLPIANKKQEDIKTKIEELKEYMLQIKEPTDDIGIHCTTPYDCPFFKHCTKHLLNNNVFNIMRMPKTKKFDLYHKGIYSYEDLLNENINLTYKQQIEFELFNKKPSIKKDKIKEFLDTLSYPLYFLDFETFQQSIPKYEGIKPYEKIPFQYSLHYIENKNGKIKHKEFLSHADIDPRRILAESLIKDIPKDVCVLAYNMGFEKGVIKKLAEIYPDLENHLMNIHDNIKDLMIPFSKRYYYTKDMKGSYSIKYVLPALFKDDPSLDYHNLNQVHNGTEAMDVFTSLGNYNKEEQKEMRKNLLKYCKLDTFAMVKIWQKLIEETSKIEV